ncbi:hypothetical protein SLS60_005867 [Paraconiothyrium brasiliense]|uniref:Uncharacterized protein n=1 Tax=Paraconiothyrium brasiliense TaxID=300254 RepID=A0ABR3RDE2_9PLEO
MKKATWWRFNSMPGWKCENPEHTKVYYILKKMKPTSKFDVIEVKNGKLQVVGNRRGGSEPSTFTKQGGNYLLVNGGFFKMDNTFRSVGRTSVTNDRRRYVPIPQRYAQYYEKVTGEDGSYLSSGPSLKHRLNVQRPEFLWNTANSEITGSLAHASQPNERLVLVKTSTGDKFIFVYTAENPRKSSTRGHPGNGQTVNEMRTLILLWLKHFRPGVKTSSIIQFVNLDGGGSIYVSWNKGSRERRIARGNIGDETPHGTIKDPESGRILDPRTVPSFIKLFTTTLETIEE